MPEPRPEPRLLPRWLPRSNAGVLPSSMDDRPAEDVIDIGALTATIWRGKWRVLFWTLFAIFGGGVYAYVLATPVFVATTSVVLETRESQVVNFDSVIGGLRTDSSAVNTEVEILKGRLLMGRVVDALDLVSDPEFNGALQPPTVVGSLISNLTDQIKTLLSVPPEPEVVVSPEALRERIISALIDQVTISNTPLSLVFTVTLQTEEGRKSALIADTIARLYINDQIAVKYEATQQATEWLAQRVTELQGDLEAAEAKVKEFRAGSDVVDPTALEQADQQMAALRARLAEQEALQATGAARVATLAAATTLAEKMQAADDPSLTRLGQNRDTAADAAVADAAIDRRFAEVSAVARLDVQRAAAQIASLSLSRDALQATISRQSDAMSQFQQLTREADSVRLIYEYFLNRLQETSVQQGLQQADSRVLSPAVVPERPASPQKPRILAIAAVLGMMLGMGLVFLQETRAKGFRSGRDLERTTGYPVMGQIPIIKGRGHRAVLSYLASKPTSSAAEAIRNLRTSVLLSNIDDPPRVIMTTSALPSEGKTTTALALIQNLVGMKRKVLLIEGDLRRRAVSRMAAEGAPRTARRPAIQPGLLAVLTGEKTLDEVIVKDDLLGVDVLMGEPSDTNAADIFSSDSFARLLATVRDIYDVIIIDTPPVLLVPDARVIAQHADAILFIVRWNWTTVGQVRDGLRMFESVNRKVSGLVLSQINTRQVRKYGDSDTYGLYAPYARSYYRN